MTSIAHPPYPRITNWNNNNSIDMEWEGRTSFQDIFFLFLAKLRCDAISCNSGQWSTKKLRLIWKVFNSHRTSTPSLRSCTAKFTHTHTHSPDDGKKLFRYIHQRKFEEHTHTLSQCTASHTHTHTAIRHTVVCQCTKHVFLYFLFKNDGSSLCL